MQNNSFITILSNFDGQISQLVNTDCSGYAVLSAIKSVGGENFNQEDAQEIIKKGKTKGFNNLSKYVYEYFKYTYIKKEQKSSFKDIYNFVLENVSIGKPGIANIDGFKKSGSQYQHVIYIIGILNNMFYCKDQENNHGFVIFKEENKKWVLDNQISCFPYNTGWTGEVTSVGFGL